MAGPANFRGGSPGNSGIDNKAKHVEYLHMLEVPTAAKMEEIAEKQEKNEELSRTAAGVIQAIKEAQYRHITEPMPKRLRNNEDSDGNVNHFDGDHETHARSSGELAARETWKRVARIARRAGGDDEDSPDEEEEGELTEEQRATRRRRGREKVALKEHAKMMDLQYFLEMVDLKHRYGSNLRAYHEEWKKADTNENFFYWLDYGEGKQINVAGCPRERLDSEQVRYLSREERMDYLVKIDDEGRLCWAKNGARIDTSEKYKDSIHGMHSFLLINICRDAHRCSQVLTRSTGIVPMDDTTPAFSARGTAAREHARVSSTISSSSFSSSSASSPTSNFMDKSTSNEGDHYVNEELRQAKGFQKVKHVSAATILNNLLRKTVRRNTWIFV
ncbi:MAG: hypothetical protein M1839_001532 [Geoglossum umbratile]|nr:MAG: hypothetical protein M1839_001532 [Geoglossum umbratile]